MIHMTLCVFPLKLALYSQGIRSRRELGEVCYAFSPLINCTNYAHVSLRL